VVSTPVSCSGCPRPRSVPQGVSLIQGFNSNIILRNLSLSADIRTASSNKLRKTTLRKQTLCWVETQREVRCRNCRTPASKCGYNIKLKWGDRSVWTGRVVRNTTLRLRVPQGLGNFFTSWPTLIYSTRTLQSVSCPDWVSNERISEWWVGEDVEAFVAKFKASRNLPGGTEENHENRTQDSRSPSRDLKPVAPEFMIQ
jgi:hypothetical protein